jgi:hypothetical protein
VAKKGGILEEARKRARQAKGPPNKRLDPDAVDALVAKSKAAVRSRLKRSRRRKIPD